MLVSSGHAGARQQRKFYVLVEDTAWDRDWVRERAQALPLTPIITGEVALEQALRALPEEDVPLVVMLLPPVGGLALTRHVRQAVSRIRATHATTAIVFIASAAQRVRSATLPPFVFVSDPANTDLRSAALDAVARGAELNWSSRNRGNGGVHAAAGPVVAAITGACSVADSLFPTANFNIRHVSMLVPYAMASAQSGLEVSVEISPQEALLYFGKPIGSGAVRAVTQVLAELKAIVVELNTVLGAQLRLHLDHADDLDIIMAACDGNFDSIMADGSGRTLEQNIAFTNAAQRITKRYGIPLEGEVGCIDGCGLRKWNKTRTEDLRHFLQSTETDFVGVNIGQFHGFDYEFSMTRQRLVEIAAIDGPVQAADGRAFVQACDLVDDRLRQERFELSSPSRRLIAELARSYIDQVNADGISVDATLDRGRRAVPFELRPLIDELEHAWLSARLEATAAKTRIWGSIFDSQPPRKRRHATLDHGLLRLLDTELRGHCTRIVLHGGSSISRDELRTLRGHKVARVNFGTDVFAAYLDALRAMMPESRHAQPAGDFAFRMRLLAVGAHRWRDWLDQPPMEIAAFADYLTTDYLAPLSHQLLDETAPARNAARYMS